MAAQDLLRNKVAGTPTIYAYSGVRRPFFYAFGHQNPKSVSVTNIILVWQQISGGHIVDFQAFAGLLRKTCNPKGLCKHLTVK